MWWLALFLGGGLVLASSSRRKPIASDPAPGQPRGTSEQCKNCWIYSQWCNGKGLGAAVEWLRAEAIAVDQSPGGGTVADWLRVAALWESYGYTEAAACFAAYGQGY